jgi:hypothetical protein
VTLSNYTLTNDFYVVDLADTDIVLGVQWLHSLGEIKMNYQVMEMKFNTKNDKKVVLRGMPNGGRKIVSNKSMEAIFIHGYVACAIESLIIAQEDTGGRQHHHADVQALLRKHDKVFRHIPPGRPPDRGFEHTIELEEGAKLVITTPYICPNKFKDEIEEAIKELLDMGYIIPSSSPFASSIVLVKKKDDMMQMCIEYRVLNKKTIKKYTLSPRLISF